MRARDGGEAVTLLLEKGAELESKDTRRVQGHGGWGGARDGGEAVTGAPS